MKTWHVVAIWIVVYLGWMSACAYYDGFGWQPSAGYTRNAKGN